jgi:RHS repeat-associated protein
MICLEEPRGMRHRSDKKPNAVSPCYDYLRYYDTTIGEFLSQDPLGYASGSTNLHEAFGDDPINNEDPSGLMFETGLEDFASTPSSQLLSFGPTTPESAGPALNGGVATGFVSSDNSTDQSTLTGDETPVTPAPTSGAWLAGALGSIQGTPAGAIEAGSVGVQTGSTGLSLPNGLGGDNYDENAQLITEIANDAYPNGTVSPRGFSQMMPYGTDDDILADGTSQQVVNYLLADQAQQAEIAAGLQLEPIPTGEPQYPSFLDVLKTGGGVLAGLLGGENSAEELEEEELEQEEASNSQSQTVNNSLATDEALETGILREVTPSQAGVAGLGGRLGNATTRAQISSLATDLESQGYIITDGGGEAPEEFIRGPNGGSLGGTYVDLTATNGTSTIRIQTVDTLADGVTPTPDEAAAAARIRTAFPNDQLILIPKAK